MSPEKGQPDPTLNEHFVSSALIMFFVFFCIGICTIWLTVSFFIPWSNNWFGLLIGVACFILLLIIVAHFAKIKYDPKNINPFFTALAGLLVAIATILSVIFGSGIVGPAFTNFINPKYTIMEATVYIQPASIQGSNITHPVYPFCVHWQDGQEYRIAAYSNNVPIGVYILNESYYKQFIPAPISSNMVINPSKFNYMLGASSIYGYSTPYRPPKSGNYFILISNEANQAVTVNLTIEASDTCADYPMIGGNEPSYQFTSS
jgi:hypothetical protein